VTLARLSVAIAIALCACNSWPDPDGSRLETSDYHTAPVQGPATAHADAGTDLWTPPPPKTVDVPDASAPADAGAGGCQVLEGRYDQAAVKYEGNTGVCVTSANNGNSNASSGAFIVTKLDVGLYETRAVTSGSSPLTWTLNDSKCELARSTNQSWPIQNADGKTVTITNSSVSRMQVDGSRLVFDATSDLSSNPAGETGYPCRITAHTTATKQ
jgi:hypothetical protein